MPKISDEAMAARRGEILRAAKRCFARNGFSATTIADLCREAACSAGGVYTHFANKHAIVAAIGQTAVESAGPDQPLDLAALLDHLASDAGEEDARLDLNLWAEALRDDTLRALVTAAMDEHQRTLKALVPASRRGAGWLQLFEALSLGLEVQRALGRRRGPSLRRALLELAGG